ncbi:MAG: DUF3576 domain-containing protein [Rickettsiales bacterium]
MKKILYIITFSIIISSCSNSSLESPTSTKSVEEARRESRGKLTGDEGISFGGPTKSGAGAASPIGVNSFLWRATIDTLSFMPFMSADPFGGVIITDWYEDPATKDIRFKVNAIIIDRALRSDGIKVTLFKQKLVKGNWRDIKSPPQDAHKIEDTILTRARELKIKQ